jgi:hypothetical protein
MVNFLITVEQNIEIDVSGTLVYKLGASQRVLNVLELVQQRQRCQSRLYLEPTLERVSRRPGKAYRLHKPH